MKLLFHVQHLLGIGHVRRAAAIARAIGREGVEVTVAQGGFAVPGTDWGAAHVVQLPPARAADAGFRTLLGADRAPVDPAWKKRRAAALLELRAAVRPDVLLVETFPFGRRAFGFELEPLVEIARRGGALVASSVRDILVDKGDAGKAEAMADAARAWFDLVLVHGDPVLAPFEASFPPAPRIADLIRYTGYVAAEPRPDSPDGRDEIVVSVGGGAVGAALLRAALAARPLSAQAGTRWRMLAGPDVPASDVAALAAQAPPGVIVEPARPDFPALLRHCRASVSQAGYNTVADLLAAGCPAVLVPFAAPGETEQAQRARLLAERGLAIVVDEADLTPHRLAQAIDAAIAAGRPPPAEVRLDGAATTARLLVEAAERRNRPHLS